MEEHSQIEYIAMKLQEWTGDAVIAKLKSGVQIEVIPGVWYLRLASIDLGQLGESVHNYEIRRYDQSDDLVRQVYHALAFTFPLANNPVMDFDDSDMEARPVIYFSLSQTVDFPPGFETPVTPTESISIRYDDYGFQTVITAGKPPTSENEPL